MRGLSHIKFDEREEQLPNDMMNIGAPPGALFREVTIMQEGNYRRARLINTYPVSEEDLKLKEDLQLT